MSPNLLGQVAESHVYLEQQHEGAELELQVGRECIHNLTQGRWPENSRGCTSISHKVKINDENLTHIATVQISRSLELVAL